LIGERDIVLHECRRCGTTLDSEADDCDACGCEDVAQYIIE
jgi:ribosomal protein L37E